MTCLCYAVDVLMIVWCDSLVWFRKITWTSYYTKLGRQIRRTNDITNIKSGSDWLLMSISRGYWCCLCWRTKFFIFQSFFYSKQVFGPHTAKTQPIWIKFCTLLLYGIHLHILFDLWRKLTKLSRKNRFWTVASPGACGTLDSLVLRSSSNMLLVLLTVHNEFRRFPDSNVAYLRVIM